MVRLGRRTRWAWAGAVTATVAGVLLLRTTAAPPVEEAEQRLLRANPAAQLAHQQGERAYASGDMGEARRGFETAARLEPKSAQALLNLAAVLDRLGRRGEALAALAGALELKPRWGRAWAARAQLLVDEGQFTEAEAAALQATRLAPGDAEPWLALARAALSREKPAESEQAARRAVKVNPSLPSAWLALGDALARQPGGGAEALAAFKKAQELDPGYYPHLRLGEALRQAGRLAEAVPALEAAARLAPRDPGPANQLSMALAEAGRTAESRKWAARARELQERRYRVITLTRRAEQAPGDAPLQLRLAAELRATGDAAGAMRAYRKALALDPGNQDARRALAALEAGSAE